jgi:hypothetical protein
VLVIEMLAWCKSDKANGKISKKSP